MATTKTPLEKNRKERRKPAHIKVVVKKDYYLGAKVAALLATVPPIVIAIGTSAAALSGADLGNLPWYTVPLGVLAAAYDIFSTRFPNAQVRAAVESLAVPAKEWKGPGPKWVPLFIAKHLTFPASIEQEEFPANPELVSKMPDNQEMRVYMMKPMRITSANSKPLAKGEDDVLNGRLTFEPTVAVQWQVECEGFFQFYVNIPGKNWNEKRFFIHKMLRDTAESVLRTVIPALTAAEVNAGQDHIINAVWDELDAVTDQWGIKIVDVGIKGLEPPKRTNQSLEDITTAKATAQAKIITATADKQKAIIEAEGAKEATILAAEGSFVETSLRGQAVKAEAAAMGMKAERLREITAIESSVGEGDLVLIGEQATEQLLGMVGAATRLGQKRGES